MTIIIVIRSSRLLIVACIVTTIMHSSQTDDHQVWTSTVLHAWYPPVYIYCIAISSPCLFLWSNTVLYPLHLLYLFLFFPSLFVFSLLPPSLFSLSPPHYHQLETGIFSYTYTKSHIALQAEAPDQWWTHSFSSGYGWKDIVHNHAYFLLVHDRHAQHHHDTLTYVHCIKLCNVCYDRVDSGRRMVLVSASSKTRVWQTGSCTCATVQKSYMSGWSVCTIWAAWFPSGTWRGWPYWTAGGINPGQPR